MFALSSTSVSSWYVTTIQLKSFIILFAMWPYLFAMLVAAVSSGTRAHKQTDHTNNVIASLEAKLATGHPVGRAQSMQDMFCCMCVSVARDVRSAVRNIAVYIGGDVSNMST